MILTRRFGALRARRVFESVTEQDDQVEHHGDVTVLDHGPEVDTTREDESAA
jgi:hypothetical protein